MTTILAAQWRRTLASPFYLLSMLLLSIVLALAVGGQRPDLMRVEVLADPDVDEAQLAGWMEALSSSDDFRFVPGAEERTMRSLASGGAGLALRLGQDGWRVLAAENEVQAETLAAYVATVAGEEAALRAAVPADQVAGLRRAVRERMAEPALRVVAARAGAEQGFSYDPRVQALLGMGLLFATFTILSGVQGILQDRSIGVWDRVIISPTSRFSMYWGHMAFAFMTGMAQVGVVFLLFHHLFGVRLGQQPLLVVVVLALFVFAVVAIGMLIAGLVGNESQMSVLIPIVATGSAMLGGAYWPLEIVSNPVLIALSKALPITYAIEALKGITYHGQGWAELAQPLSLLLLIGVVCMGVGMKLVDRRG